MALAQLLAELDSGNPCHLDVGYDDVHGLGPEVLERLLCGVYGIDIKATLTQTIAQEYGGIVLVVDDENGTIHW